MAKFIVKTPDGFVRVSGDYWEVSNSGTLWIRTAADPSKDFAFNQHFWQKVNAE